MKKIKLICALPALGMAMLDLPALAQSTQCVAPPALQNPRTCQISTAGGSCSFAADEDGVVRFPEQVVNGQITISGGRTVHLIGGHVVAPKGSNYAVAFNYPTNVFVEGMLVDANGQCDAFAIRNHLEHQTDFTFQNVYATGPGYTAECHGDLIQNQNELRDGGMTLHVENFVGVTNGQGLFIPHRSYGVGYVDLKNVYIRMPLANTFTYPLLWLYAPERTAKDRPQTVVLDNVNVDWAIDSNGNVAGPQLYSATGTYSGETYSFDQPDITGVVNKWRPDGTDLDYAAHTGLNYDRAWFCSEQVADSTPVTEPILDTEPVLQDGSDLVAETDITAPSVQFDWPIDGSLLQRRFTTTILVTAADDVEVSDIELRIGGRRVARFEGPGPHSYEWKVKRGHDSVTISAEATDMSGNRGEASLLVNVEK